MHVFLGRAMITPRHFDTFCKQFGRQSLCFEYEKTCFPYVFTYANVVTTCSNIWVWVNPENWSVNNWLVFFKQEGLSIIYGIILPIDVHIFQDCYCTTLTRWLVSWFWPLASRPWIFDPYNTLKAFDGQNCQWRTSGSPHQSWMGSQDAMELRPYTFRLLGAKNSGCSQYFEWSIMVNNGYHNGQ